MSFLYSSCICLAFSVGTSCGGSRILNVSKSNGCVKRTTSRSCFMIYVINDLASNATRAQHDLPLTSHRLHSGPPVYMVNFGSLLAVFAVGATFKSRELVEKERDERILRKAAMVS